MCLDGGEIWECDMPNCGCAVCSNCVEIPAEKHSKLNAPNVKFTCVQCHWCWDESRAPYLVSAFLFLFILARNIFEFFIGVYN